MANMNVKDILLSDIDADDDFNCRGNIAPIDVSDLATDIEAQGLLMPGIVMLHPDESSTFKYKLVAGFRRRKAIEILGRKTFSCNIREEMKDEDSMFVNLSENIQRCDLSIMQEATAIAKIKAKFPGANREYCAERLKKSPGWVQVREQLLCLPPEIQQEVAAGIITQSQIRELNTVLKKEGKERCYEVAKEIKKAKTAGRKPRIMKKKNRDAIRERKRPEIFEMLADMNDSLPYSDDLWPKAMAWCAGEISDNILFEACAAFAKRNGGIWSTPDCDARDHVPGLDG